MAEFDGTHARFNEIAHYEQNAQMLAVPTPPWDIAACGDMIIPTQQQRVSPKDAKDACRYLIEMAVREDVLFAPTLATAATTARWQADHGMPIGGLNVGALIDDAAYLAWHYPNPGNVLQVRAHMERAAERRDDCAQHRRYIAMAATLRRGLSKPTADTLLAYAEASLSLTRRQLAFESVLKTVYGDRYEFWKSISDLS